MITMTYLMEIVDDKHKLTADIVGSDNIPTELFLYRVDLDEVEIYSGVCNLSNIEDFETYLKPGIPFLRKSHYESLFASHTELETALDDIKTLLTELDEDYAYILLGYNETKTEVLNG